MKYENLTELQKIALRGQVSVMLSFSKTNWDLKYKIYKVLKSVGSPHRELFLEAIKESVTLSEEEVIKLYFITSMNEIPVYLWINKTIADIKYYLKVPEDFVKNLNVALNKKQERINIIKSTFINFGRKVVLTSPEALTELINKIQEDEELEFLASSCIYLKGCCLEVQNLSQKRSKDITDNIFEIEFDPYDIMSVELETERLNNLDNCSSSCEETSKKYENPKVIKVVQINLDKNQELSSEEISELINKQIEAIINASEETVSTEQHNQKNKSRLTYVVQKKFKNTNIKEDIKQYDSEEEALDFINKIYETKPELNRTCELIVCKKIIEE